MIDRPEPDRRAFGLLLREWRRVRRMSQLAVAIEASISPRHLSFVESGRSVPSRDMVLTLTKTLDVPLRERNALLVAAGYAPIYSERTLASSVLAQVCHALARLLDHHEPYPAVVLDRQWNVLQTNRAAPRLFALFVDLEAGDLAVKDWRGECVRPTTWPEFRDLVVFLAGPNPALPPEASMAGPMRA